MQTDPNQQFTSEHNEIIPDQSMCEVVVSSGGHFPASEGLQHDFHVDSKIIILVGKVVAIVEIYM